MRRFVRCVAKIAHEEVLSSLWKFCEESARSRLAWFCQNKSDYFIVECSSLLRCLRFEVVRPRPVLFEPHDYDFVADSALVLKTEHDRSGLDRVRYIKGIVVADDRHRYGALRTSHVGCDQADEKQGHARCRRKS